MLSETQRTLLSMYKDIARVLDDAGFVFYVDYGTAIGAVRHDGFIPWDDDIDVVVWGKDLPGILDALEKGLDQEKYYVHRSAADTHPHVIARTENFEEDLREKRAPFIDIFPIVGYPNGRVRRFLSRVFIWGALGFTHVTNKFESYTAYRALRRGVGFCLRQADRLRGGSEEPTVVYTTSFENEIFPG